MVRKIRSAVVASLLLGAVLAVEAAGLGKLTVNSSLGQVLNAEIDLVSLQPGELDSLTARVAPPEAFREARIEYSPVLRLLRFSVEKRPSGQPYIKVTSVGPINEPFVDMLVEVSWPAGRLQREYPILLDPPGYAQAKVAPPTVAAARPAETPPAAAPAAAPSTPDTAATGTPSAKEELPTTPVEPPAAGDTYGPVQKGDTLNKIATEVKPSSVSLEQMLVALYRENKGAFVNNNMNRLKTGQILKVPSAEDIGRVAQPEARREIRTHVADWKAYREQLAGAVGAIPARAETSQAAAGRVTSAAVVPPPAPTAEPKDVLKLSKTDTGKVGATKGGAATQDRINALQEELTAKDQALREAQSRVADLERQIRDMQRLVELKGAAPAKPADAKVAAVAPPPAKPAEAPKPADVKPAEAPKPTEPAKVAVAPKAPDAAKPAEPGKPAEAVKPAEAPKVAEAPKQPAPPKAPPKKAPPPPPTIMDQAMDNLPYIVGGLGLLGLLGFAGFMINKRRKAAAEAEPGPASATSAFPADLKPSTTAAKPGGGLVDTGNSSFLTDFDKTGPGTIDTDEVDPVAEAEVYIAYGRDAQAEEILKEAMARDKNRHEIALKLLEIYHARKSATAFETVAKELRGAVGESSPLWQKAAAMGAQIDPTNPLYAGAAGSESFPSAPAAAPKPDLDFDVAPSGSASAPPGKFDLDLEGPKSTPVAPDLPVEPSSKLDFDITPSGGQRVDVPAEPPKEEKPSFDFDLSGLELPGKPSAGQPDAGKAKAASGQGLSLDLTDLNLDTPAGGEAAAAGGEAVGTKLELAKAYLEIGDKDGAREILEEVAREGSAAQKDEAKKLISSL